MASSGTGSGALNSTPTSNSAEEEHEKEEARDKELAEWRLVRLTNVMLSEPLHFAMWEVK